MPDRVVLDPQGSGQQEADYRPRHRDEGDHREHASTPDWRSRTYRASWRSNSGHHLGSPSTSPPGGHPGGRDPGPPPPPSPSSPGPPPRSSPGRVHTCSVAMIAAMLRTIINPLTAIAHVGPRIASSQPQRTHVHAEESVAISGQLACPRRGSSSPDDTSGLRLKSLAPEPFTAYSHYRRLTSQSDDVAVRTGGPRTPSSH